MGEAKSVADVQSKHAQILNRAADLIEPDGAWKRGYLCHGRDGRPCYGAVTGADFCATSWSLCGSLQKAGWLQARDDEKLAGSAFLISYHRETPALARIIATTLGLDTNEAIIDWEDAPERTKAEVVAVLREAARAAISRAEA